MTTSHDSAIRLFLPIIIILAILVSYSQRDNRISSKFQYSSNKNTEPQDDYTFRLYIFDQNHRLTSEDEYEKKYLNTEIEYIQVSNMDEVKEDFLNRRFQYGISEYGIMLAPNKCRIQSWPYGFDNHYIEDDELLIPTLENWSIGKGDAISGILWHMEHEHGGMTELLNSHSNHFTILRIYSYNKQRLNIENMQIKYIDVNNENDIKHDLLLSGFHTLRTYLILDENIKIKNLLEGYGNYKVATEQEINARVEDILSDRYDSTHKTIAVFTIYRNFDTQGNYRRIPISNIGEVKQTFKKLSKEADPYTFENYYCYVLMPNAEIRIYDTHGDKFDWTVVDTIKEVGYNELHDLFEKMDRYAYVSMPNNERRIYDSHNWVVVDAFKKLKYGELRDLFRKNSCGSKVALK